VYRTRLPRQVGWQGIEQQRACGIALPAGLGVNDCQNHIYTVNKAPKVNMTKILLRRIERLIGSPLAPGA
jgi:hypothetical protein